MISAFELQARLHKDIPLCAAMGLEVLSSDKSSARLRFPLNNNINHLGTVFGGSLYAAAALSCYAYFFTLIDGSQAQSAELMIGEGKITYFLPVTQDFVIETQSPSQQEITQFFETFSRRGRARLTLSAKIQDQNKTQVLFVGDYVAIKS